MIPLTLLFLHIRCHHTFPNSHSSFPDSVAAEFNRAHFSYAKQVTFFFFETYFPLTNTLWASSKTLSLPHIPKELILEKMERAFSRQLGRPILNRKSNKGGGGSGPFPRSHRAASLWKMSSAVNSPGRDCYLPHHSRQRRTGCYEYSVNLRARVKTILSVSQAHVYLVFFKLQERTLLFWSVRKLYPRMEQCRTDQSPYFHFIIEKKAPSGL